jgi:hypothetical protein
VARFEVPTRADLLAASREQYQRRFPALDVPTPVARNVRPTLIVLGAEGVEIPYCGRMYELIPVSFEDGLRLTEARARVTDLHDRDLTPDNLRAYRGALRVIVRMAPKYLVPRGRLRRVLWRLRVRRNPFRDATDAEVGELLGFFLGCRMMSRVRYPTT